MIPVLDAYADHDPGGGRGRWLVWCSHCRCWHAHGAGPGHRVAHCHDDDSPYAESGYTLRYAGEWPPEPDAA